MTVKKIMAECEEHGDEEHEEEDHSDEEEKSRKISNTSFTETHSHMGIVQEER